MRTRWIISHENKTVNATKLSSIVANGMPSIEGRSGLASVGPWWRVSHHFTLKCTMGTLRNASIDPNAVRRARVVGEAGSWRSVTTPRYMSSNTSVLAIRASRSRKNVPQVPRPQIAPRTNVIVTKKTPMCAAAPAA